MSRLEVPSRNSAECNQSGGEGGAYEQVELSADL